MVTIKEDYCSYEVAKLLKENGFNGECLSMYLTPKPHCGMGNPNEPKIAPHGRDSHYYEGYLYQCEAPTLQTAMKWLREVHHHIIEIHYGNVGSPREPEIQWWWELENEQGEFLDGNITDGNATYEEACNAAIRFCLENLI